MLTANMECTESSLLREAFLCHEATFRTLAEAITAGIFVSRGKSLHYVNHAAQTITGFTREELLRMSFWDFVHPDSRELVLEQDRVRQRDIIVHAQHEIKIFAKSGEERWLDIQTGVIEFDGALSTLISACDFTKHKRIEEQLQRLSVTDPLTGLGNYRRLIEALEAEVKRSGRTGQPFAILVFDLDRLKKINDCYGHSVGSQALRRLGDVLRINCRAIDTATRFGGDEFAVILPEMSAAAANFRECGSGYLSERWQNDRSSTLCG